MPVPDRRTLHDLAALFFFLAAETDRTLETPEVDTLVARLQVHAEGWDELDVREIVVEAADDAIQRPVHRIVEDLKYAALPDAMRAAVLDDLVRIAHADGRLHINELAFVRALAHAWELDVPEGLGDAS